MGFINGIRAPNILPVPKIPSYERKMEFSSPGCLNDSLSPFHFEHNNIPCYILIPVQSGRLKVDFFCQLFRRFGFQSGRNVDKFADFPYCRRSSNGLYYVTAGTNAYISATVEQTIDLGSHTLFIAAADDMEVLSAVPSATYAYYQSQIKPKPAQTAPAGKTVWRCTVCGYIYEGEELPADYVCPLCKHPASDFEKVTV